ncbi:MAG TPA: hypothetical protein VG122_04365 [Gemmata sp.]|jgi:hypothetical protein|nr:hypothetical protein [Gemmata sp.]
MSKPSQLLSRVQKAIGPPAATMFAEQGQSRHFILEVTLTAVALYVLGKYLDGFMEGLGVNDLGKQHGQAVKNAIQFGVDTYTGKVKPNEHEVEEQVEAVSVVVVALQEYKTEPRALESGSTKVLLALEEPGIPQSEAKRITNDLVRAVWQP